MSKYKLSKAREEFVDSFLNYILENEDNWINPLIGKEAFNPKTKTVYQGINRVILMLATNIYQYKDPRWLTFKQIQDMGYKLENAKGKGVKIEKFSMYDIETKKYITYSEAVKISKQENLDKLDFYERFKYSSISYTVFNASLVNGIEEYVETRKEIDSNKVADQMIINYLENTNLKYTEKDNRMYYSEPEDFINIPSQNKFINDYEYYSAVFHEIAHSTMHSSRLNRTVKGGFGSKEYVIEELRAEMSSVFICNDLNITNEENIKNNASYIHSWYEVINDNKNLLFEAITEAQNIVEYVEEKGLMKELIKENCQEEQLSR